MQSTGKYMLGCEHGITFGCSLQTTCTYKIKTWPSHFCFTDVTKSSLCTLIGPDLIGNFAESIPVVQHETLKSKSKDKDIGKFYLQKPMLKIMVPFYKEGFFRKTRHGLCNLCVIS